MFEIHDVVERYLGSTADPRSAYSDLSSTLKAEMKAGHWQGLADVLPATDRSGAGLHLGDFAQSGAGPGVAADEASRTPAKSPSWEASRPTSSLTCSSFISPADKVAPEVYEADYGTFRQEMLDPESELYKFQPRFIILATSWRDLGHLPDLGDDRAEVQRKVEAELADWSLLWRTAHDRLGCQIIQNNFDAPRGGRWETTKRGTPPASAVRDARQPAPCRMPRLRIVTIHDIDNLSAIVGPLGVGRRSLLSACQAALLARAPGRLCS